MKGLSIAILCIIVGIILTVSIQKVEAACNQADLNTQITSINALLEDLKDPSKSTSESTINTKVASALAVATSCENVMDGMVETKKNYLETYDTDRCVLANTTSEAYKLDPCCNPELFETTCCRSRDVTVSRELLTKFKNKDVWTGCAPSDDDLEKVRSTVRYYKRRMENQKRQCDHVRSYHDFFQTKLEKAFKACKTAIFATDKKCFSDSDCYSNACIPKSDSEAQTYVCRPASVDISNGGDQSLARCLMNYLPNENIRIMQEALGLATDKTLTLSEITTGLATTVGKDACVEERYDTTTNKWISKTALFASKATCEAEKACNDGSATCANSDNFCGAFCDNYIKDLSDAEKSKGVCQSVESTLTTQAKCDDPLEKTGSCQADIQFHASTASSALVTKAEGCTDYKWCSLKCTTHPCGEVECQENTKVCYGPDPVTYDTKGNARSRCVVPHKMSTSEPHIAECATGQTDVGFGCITDDATAGACNTNNKFSADVIAKWEAIYEKDFPYPSWEKVPSNIEACTRTTQPPDTVATEILYRTCKHPNGAMTIRGEKQCSRCGGITETLYRVQPGVYNQGMWTKRTAWLQRKLVNKYRWTSILDDSKFDTFAQNVMKSVRAYAQEQYVACATQPIFEVLKKFTCSCEAGTDCFQVDPRPIGSFVAYPDALDHVIMADVEVYINRDSIPATVTGGQKEIIVSTTQLDYDDGSEALSEVIPRYPINNDDGELVGMVVGNGVKLNVAYEKGVTVCLKIDRQANITVFSGPKFATYQEGKYVVDTAVENPISNKPNMVCGLVKDQNLYYPVLVDVRRFRPPSAASTLSVSITLMVALVCYILMV